MEALGSFARGSLALAAFFLLFFAIAHATAGRALVAIVTLAAGLAATMLLVRSRAPPAAERSKP